MIIFIPTYLLGWKKQGKEREERVEREERHRKRQGLIDVEGIQSCNSQERHSGRSERKVR